MKLRNGFTIVELMMVIAIIAVLMTMVTTTAGSAIRRARVRKAEALVTVVQQGINTYYAQKDEWPGNWYSDSLNGDSGDETVYTLKDSEVDACIREVVRESTIGKNPMLDVTGLYVTDSPNSNKAAGMDFMDAIHGTKQHPNKILSLSTMYFGYPEEKHGYFRRFTITYSITSDRITVSQ